MIPASLVSAASWVARGTAFLYPSKVFSPAVLTLFAVSAGAGLMEPSRWVPPSMLADLRRLPNFGEDLLQFHFGVQGIERSPYFRARDRMLADLSRALQPARRFFSREAAFYHR